MIIAAIVATPFLAALLLLSLRVRSAVQGWISAGIIGVLFGVLLAHLSIVQETGPVQFSIPWMPQIGLSFSLLLDGLALLFGLLITGIGAAIHYYAGYYFENEKESRRFLSLLLAFTGSMLLLVIAGNILTLFIAWELTSIISFLLISFKGKKDAKARAGASQALVITGGGGLALLLGLLLLGTAAGSMEWSDILSSGDVLRTHAWYPALLALIAIGCFTKSAQVPLHFWLPDAMSAPTPASGFLHSATMVKAGIYLLLRLSPVLGGDALWTAVLTTFGLITLIVGAALALRQDDLKGALAYSTISQLGALVALIGLPGEIGIKAALVGVLAHALYKAPLFLVVGAVDHATGTRLLSKLGGLRQSMPGFAAVAGISALSMAGVIPLFGFVSKELLLKAIIDTPGFSVALIIVVISAIFSVCMATILFWDVFMGSRRATPDDHHDNQREHPLPHPMVYAPMGLAAASVIFGVGVSPLVTPLLEPAARSKVSLYLIAPYGIDLALVLSTVAIIVGAALFAFRRQWRSLQIPTLFTGAQGYRLAVRGVERVGDVLLRSQGGKIRYYLSGILIGVVALMSTAGVGTLLNSAAPSFALRNAAELLKAVLLVLSITATFASITFKQHLLAALALGVAGYSIGGIFLLEPAPDVALVQFLVETLATVLIIMILTKTSTAEREKVIGVVWDQTRLGIWRDAAIAILVGTGVALFATAAVNSRPTPQAVANWHLQNALPQAGANDVVAAIITDFRGTDTLIEITVFGMAALGVLTLLAKPEIGERARRVFQTPYLLRRIRARVLRLELPEPMSEYSPEQYAGVAVPSASREDSEALMLHDPLPAPPEMPAPTPSLLDALTRVMAVLTLPFALLIALSHLLYAGSAPGDGFTAGVIAGLGVALWYIIYGYTEAKKRLTWLHPVRFIGLGLFIAFTNAVLPLLFGREFLAFTLVQEITLPADIKLASPLIFEIGIFFAVFGGASAIMEAITHPKEVESM